jgi:hypothetical protein
MKVLLGIVLLCVTNSCTKDDGPDEWKGYTNISDDTNTSGLLVHLELNFLGAGVSGVVVTYQGDQDKKKHTVEYVYGESFGQTNGEQFDLDPDNPVGPNSVDVPPTLSPETQKSFKNLIQPTTLTIKRRDLSTRLVLRSDGETKISFLAENIKKLDLSTAVPAYVAFLEKDWYSQNINHVD